MHVYVCVEINFSGFLLFLNMCIYLLFIMIYNYLFIYYITLKIYFKYNYRNIFIFIYLRYKYILDIIFSPIFPNF